MIQGDNYSNNSFGDQIQNNYNDYGNELNDFQNEDLHSSVNNQYEVAPLNEQVDFQGQTDDTKAEV